MCSNLKVQCFIDQFPGARVLFLIYYGKYPTEMHEFRYTYWDDIMIKYDQEAIFKRVIFVRVSYDFN